MASNYPHSHYHLTFPRAINKLGCWTVLRVLYIITLSHRLAAKLPRETRSPKSTEPELAHLLEYISGKIAQSNINWAESEKVGSKLSVSATFNPHPGS